MDLVTSEKAKQNVLNRLNAGSTSRSFASSSSGGTTPGDGGLGGVGPSALAMNAAMGGSTPRAISSRSSLGSQGSQSIQSQRVKEYFSQVKEYDQSIDRVSGPGRLRGFFNNLRGKKIDSAETVVQEYQTMMQKTRPALPTLEVDISSSFKVVVPQDNLSPVPGRGRTISSSTTNSGGQKMYQQPKFAPIPLEMSEDEDGHRFNGYQPSSPLRSPYQQQQQVINRNRTVSDSQAMASPIFSGGKMGSSQSSPRSKATAFQEPRTTDENDLDAPEILVKTPNPPTRPAPPSSSIRNRANTIHVQPSSSKTNDESPLASRKSVPARQQQQRQHQHNNIKDDNGEAQQVDDDDDGSAIARPRPQDGRDVCPHCNRYFDSDRLEKHISVCLKGKEKRKRFDSSAMRKKGTDLDPNKAPAPKNTMGFY